MPYALYSGAQKQRVSELFPTEKDMWAYVRAQGYCYEVVDRDDQEPKRVLFGDYSIYVCGHDGQPLETPIREARRKGSP